jgi:ATP-dependent protease ClpP protease subunit
MTLDDILAVLDGRKLSNKLTGREFVNITDITNAAGKKRAAIYVFDVIGYWSGNDARTFRAKLDAVQADVIDLHLNSPGGSVFEGVAIYNMLLAHPAEVHVHIDGLAASIASVIALAGDKIHIAENAMMMIHNPSAIVYGEEIDMRTMADALASVKEAILNTYESRTGLERAALAAAMDAETWYSADDAVRDGFATEKVQAKKIAAAAWTPDEWPDLPEEAKALAGNAAPKQEEKPDAEPEAEAEAEPISVGTVDDVTAARDKAAKLMAKYAL